MQVDPGLGLSVSVRVAVCQRRLFLLATVAKTKELKTRSWGCMPRGYCLVPFWKPSPVAHGSPFSTSFARKLRVDTRGALWNIPLAPEVCV